MPNTLEGTPPGLPGMTTLTMTPTEVPTGSVVTPSGPSGKTPRLPRPPPPSKAPPAPYANNARQLTSATQGAPSSPLTTALSATISQPNTKYVPPPSTPPPQRQTAASTNNSATISRTDKQGMEKQIDSNLLASRIRGFGNLNFIAKPSTEVKAEPRKAQPAVIKYPCMGVAYLLMGAGRALSPILALAGSFVAGSCMIGAAWASMGVTNIPDAKEISKATIAINDYNAARGLGVLGGNLMDWATGAKKGTTATREKDAQLKYEERPGEYGAVGGYVGGTAGFIFVCFANILSTLGEVL